MSSIAMKNASGKAAGKTELDDAVFGIEPNTAVMHQVVTAQLAAKRSLSVLLLADTCVGLTTIALL